MTDTDQPITEPVPEPTVYRGIKDGAELHTETVSIGETASAATRLRAFEDEKLGPDAPRMDGQLERGSGSPWSRMSADDRATYDKLERCVAAEEKLAAAHAALSQAEAAVMAAEAELHAVSE